ncbi:MAG: hypothetical protein ACE5DR_04385 [Thermodesulfobacteriota bacterium]
MGKYPWLRRRRFFIDKALQGRFVAGLAVLVAVGLFIDLVAAYFLIEGRLEERLYKIHLQVSSTSDIIWPVIWKLTALSVPFIILIGFILGYLLTRSLEGGLARHIGAMKSAGREGDLTVRLNGSGAHLETAQRAFNECIELLDVRLQAVQEAAAEIDNTVTGINQSARSPASALSRAEVARELDRIGKKTDYALKKLFIFKV